MRELRMFGSLALAGAVAFGVGAGLNWDQWQPIGWLVILGGASLWLTTPGGVSRIDAVIAALPSALFLLGFTAFRWQRSVWQLIDFVTVASYLAVAYFSYTHKPFQAPHPALKQDSNTKSGSRDQELYLALKSLRADLAGDQPRFVVFTDKTLNELVVKKPKSFLQLMRVYGIGPSKSAKYGSKILQIVQTHVEKHEARRADS